MNHKHIVVKICALFRTFELILISDIHDAVGIHGRIQWYLCKFDMPVYYIEGCYEL